jgi:hypothetical protein
MVKMIRKRKPVLIENGTIIVITIEADRGAKTKTRAAKTS